MAKNTTATIHDCKIFTFGDYHPTDVIDCPFLCNNSTINYCEIQGEKAGSIFSTVIFKNCPLKTDANNQPTGDQK